MHTPGHYCDLRMEEGGILEDPEIESEAAGHKQPLKWLCHFMCPWNKSYLKIKLGCSTVVSVAIYPRRSDQSVICETPLLPEFIITTATWFYFSNRRSTGGGDGLGSRFHR